MKSKIGKCVVHYNSWQMQCCGDPITLGKVADLFCIKQERYKNFVGIDIDYDEEHHGQGTNCILRGLVTRIQVIFVDKYAREEDGTRYVDDPNNEFAIIDTDYIDGREQSEKYGDRKGHDAQGYIITLDDVIERQYEDYIGYCSRGKYINIEPGDEGKELFWDEGGQLIGDTDMLTFYKGKDKQTIHLTKSPLHSYIVDWRNEFLEHIVSGYDVWNHDEWLDWWCRGYCWAKQLRKLLPEDVLLNYGEKGQCFEVITRCKAKWDLNTESHRVTIVANVAQKQEEGLFIPSCCLDWDFNQDEKQIYKFTVSHTEHHLFPDDRVMLCVDGRPAYQIGTILEVCDNAIIIQTDRWLDISEAYSIELID